MKKLSISLRIILFLLALVVPLIYMTFVNTTEDTSLSENRNMAQFPEISAENYPNIATQIDEYINDHLPFRDFIITNYSRILFYAFDTSFNTDVIKGKDGWLFYNLKTDGDPIACYKGTNLFTEEELKTIAENLQISADNIEKEGREFVVFLPPNKERMYSEYMPDYYGEPAENYSVKALYDYLKENTTVNVIYPYEELMAYKESTTDPTRDLYYKVDTHWRHYAAYIACYIILKNLNIEMTAPEDVSLYDVGFLHEDEDLARLLHMEKSMAEHIYKVSKNTFVPENPVDKKLFVVGDSFYNYMYDIMYYQFTECANEAMIQEKGVQASHIRDYNADIVLLEVAERHVDYLLDWRYE